MVQQVVQQVVLKSRSLIFVFILVLIVSCVDHDKNSLYTTVEKSNILLEECCSFYFNKIEESYCSNPKKYSNSYLLYGKFDSILLEVDSSFLSKGNYDTLLLRELKTLLLSSINDSLSEDDFGEANIEDKLVHENLMLRVRVRFLKKLYQKTMSDPYKLNTLSLNVDRLSGDTCRVYFYAYDTTLTPVYSILAPENIQVFKISNGFGYFIYPTDRKDNITATGTIRTYMDTVIKRVEKRP